MGLLKPSRAEEFKQQVALAIASMQALQALLDMLKAETAKEPAK